MWKDNGFCFSFFPLSLVSPSLLLRIFTVNFSYFFISFFFQFFKLSSLNFQVFFTVKIGTQVKLFDSFFYQILTRTYSLQSWFCDVFRDLQFKNSLQKLIILQLKKIYIIYIFNQIGLLFLLMTYSSSIFNLQQYYDKLY